MSVIASKPGRRLLGAFEVPSCSAFFGVRVVVDFEAPSVLLEFTAFEEELWLLLGDEGVEDSIEVLEASRVVPELFGVVDEAPSRVVLKVVVVLKEFGELREYSKVREVWLVVVICVPFLGESGL